MTQSTLIALASFILLLLIAATFFYLHLQSLRQETLGTWQKIREKTRLRSDMIPLLIETVKKFGVGDPKIVSEMMALRTTSWPIEELTPAKVNAELSLSNDLHSLWDAAKNNQDLSRDTNFLSAKKDITDLGKEIEALEEIYNQKIRNYNKKTELFLLKFLRIKKLPIFEFEA